MPAHRVAFVNVCAASFERRINLQMKDITAYTLTRDKWIIHVAVVISYFAKALAKGVLGVILHAPVLINDALHGAIDIGEHCLIALVGKQARKAKETLYPLGRKPLLDIVGLVIGLGMAWLALKCVKDSLVSLSVIIDSSTLFYDKLPALLLKFFPKSKPEVFTEHIWIVGLVFILCACLSLFVYRVESQLAKKHHLKEYLDDAMELEHDAMMELGTGSSILIAWGLIFILEKGFHLSNVNIIVNATVQMVILFALAVYLAFHAYKAISENTKNLLHPGLDNEKLQLLKHHLVRSLPAGCSLEQDNLGSLVAYTSGEVLHVYGVICLPRLQMSAADVILKHAQHRAKLFLLQYTEETNVKFFPEPYDWTASDAEAEWKRILKDVWGLEPQGTIWNDFILLKRGLLPNCASIALKDRDNPDAEALLLAWMQATACFLHHGADAEITKKLGKNILILLDKIKVDDARRVYFICWLVLYRITSGKLYFDRIDYDHDTELQELTIWSKKTSGVSPLLLAEANFTLGMFHERRPSFDLESSDHHYRKALSLYIEGGYPLESDRLLNTWGHQKGLLYEIEESLYLLQLSKHIKEVKDDQVGLTFTYGCLGDSYRRAGCCELAIDCYQKDISLATLIGSDATTLSVKCKQAEAEICWAVMRVNTELLDSAINKLYDLRTNEDSSKDKNFFTEKALVKGLLWMARLSGEAKGTRYVNQAFSILEDIRPFSPYTKALCSRMYARAAFLSKDISGAKDHQEKALSVFRKMVIGDSSRINSLQAICCSLELAEINCNGGTVDCTPACKELNEFIATLGGLLGPARSCMLNLIEELCSQRTSHYERNRALNSLVALLEG